MKSAFFSAHLSLFTYRRLRTGIAIPLTALLFSAPLFAQPAPQKDGAPADADTAEADDLPKPDKTHGVITGKVVDSRSGDDVVDAQVVVVNTKYRTATDIDGKYGVKLPPGVYTVRVFFPGLKARRFENVTVTAGKSVTLDAQLSAEAKAAPVEETVIEVEPDKTQASTQLLIRKKAANTSDAVSAQDIAKTPDRNAADAARRVVGATVVDNRFVFVRGLGDRYTNSLLNGTPLPSPEPDIQAIPLDIFPVLVLSDVTIIKTFTPDMPGDMTGGSVRINTRSFPEKFLLSVSATAGFNSQTTFSHRDTYRGGSTDWLGVDDGGRALPSSFPKNSVVSSAGRNSNGTPITGDDLTRYGRDLNQKGRRIYGELAPPNHGLSAVVGDKFHIAGVPFGYLVAGSYNHRYLVRDEQQSLYNVDQGRMRPRFDFHGTRSTESITTSTLGTLSVQPTKHNRLTVTGLLARSTDDEVLKIGGFEQDDSTNQAVTRSRWVERQLLFGQVQGEHKFVPLHASELKWNLFFGKAVRDEPSNTQSVYSQASDGRYSAMLDEGLSHQFFKQFETVKGGGLDYTQPLGKDTTASPKLKLGSLIQLKDRNFGARRFDYQYLRDPGTAEALFLPPDQLSAPANVGRFISLQERTQVSDSYTAKANVYAGYLMTDIPVHSAVRVIGGARVEHGSMSVNSFDPFASGGAAVTGGFETTDVLPSLSTVIAVNKSMNLRTGATQTVARPQFREIAPFAYSDFFNAARVEGNPNLKRSKITNVDARWEWFPSSDEVIAASVFYKYFVDPIEVTNLNSTEPGRSWENAKNAHNLGAELEARKNFGFVSKSLRPLSVLGNLSLVYSRVSLSDEQKTLQLDSTRPLQGQSPWVINTAIDWSTPDTSGTRLRLSYNVFGPRISAVGSFNLPSIREQPRHTLDFTAAQSIGQHLEWKLAIENILNAPFVFTQEEPSTGQDKETARWTIGTTGWVTMTYKM